MPAQTSGGDPASPFHRSWIVATLATPSIHHLKHLYGMRRLVLVSCVLRWPPIWRQKNGVSMPQIRLKSLLQQYHWQVYRTFCNEFDKAAKRVDQRLVGSWPSRAQLHRWLAGGVKGLPYPDHCRILEAMFPDWTAAQLFESVPEIRTELPADRPFDRPTPVVPPDTYSDVEAVFVTRSEFAAKMPPHKLFDGAADIRIAGLSLNMLCQQYADDGLRGLIEDGGVVHCLFLDPTGSAIAAREREEGHEPGQLSSLTALNIRILQRVGAGLTEAARDRLIIATYDEPIRFNIILVDRSIAIVQPYLHAARGITAPTMVIRRREATGGLFPIFEQTFAWLWERGSQLCST
jgi:hypothetical protein